MEIIFSVFLCIIAMTADTIAFNWTSSLEGKLIVKKPLDEDSRYIVQSADYLVSIGNEFGNRFYHYCSGFVVSEFAIVTTAFCVYNNEQKNAYSNIFAKTGMDTYAVIHSESHPLYKNREDRDRGFYDISVLTVSKRIQAAAAPLPKELHRFQAELSIPLFGWITPGYVKKHVMYVSTIARHQCVKLLESKIKCTFGLESLRRRNLLCSFRTSNDCLLRMKDMGSPVKGKSGIVGFVSGFYYNKISSVTILINILEHLEFIEIRKRKSAKKVAEYISEQTQKEAEGHSEDDCSVGSVESGA